MELTEYEQKRADRIQRNKALMDKMGFDVVRDELHSLAQQVRDHDEHDADEDEPEEEEKEKKPRKKRARRSLKALRDVEWPEGTLRTSTRLQSKRQDDFSQMKAALDAHEHALRTLREEFETWQSEFEAKVTKVEIDRGLAFARAVTTSAPTQQ